MANITENTNQDKYVSDFIRFWIQVVVHALLCGVVGMVGMATNVINIIVFLRQGIFSDNGSASLFGLAVSDFCCVTSMVWYSISFCIVLIDPPNIYFEPWDVMYLTGGWPHLMFAQITRTVTAYVALERCICVVFPFKVKSMFTPRRSILIVAAIFVCFGVSFSPVFIKLQLAFRKNTNTNVSRLVMVTSSNSVQIVNIMWYINSIAFNVGSVVVVLVSTVITVSRVNISKVWRQNLTVGSSSNPQTSQMVIDNSLKPSPVDNTSEKDPKPQCEQKLKPQFQKEIKLVRMITAISMIFGICYLPDLIYLITYSIDHEISPFSKYMNLAQIMYAFTSLMETVNSSINIIVYYKMSSRYKVEFNKLFGQT